MHIPVLSQPVLAAFGPTLSGQFVDGTFGRGGHSQVILDALAPAGELTAFDRDLEAVAAAKAIHDPRFTIVHAPFSTIPEHFAPSSLSGVLLDLGISSPQIDTATRGFSYRFDGPLDMRMDQSKGVTAAEWLASASLAEIRNVLKDYGDEKFAQNIAKHIVSAREKSPIQTTFELIRVIEGAIPKKCQDKHPAVRSFQAIRMHINDEMGELTRALEAIPKLLVPGGTLAVITFHSVEDRVVKRTFQKLSAVPHLPNVPTTFTAEFTMGRKIRATKDEVAMNPRAHSATLRTLTRQDVANEQHTP